MIRLRADITCPYCLNVFREIIETTRPHGRDFTYCPVEHGGCDKLFAYEYDLKPKIKTSTLEFDKAARREGKCGKRK